MVFPLLSGEELEDLHRRLEEKNLSIKSFEEQKTTLDRQILWLSNKEQVLRELNSIKDQEKALNEDVKAFAPLKEALDWARKAARFDGMYGNLQGAAKAAPE